MTEAEVTATGDDGSDRARLQAGSTDRPAADGSAVEGHELGRAGRILALPLVPIVALWEAARAGARVVASGLRRLGDAFTSAARFLGRAARAVGRFFTRPFRAAYQALTRFGRRAWRVLVGVWDAGLAGLRAVARSVAAGVRAVLRPFRVLAGVLASVLRRVGVALRTAAHAVAAPIRTLARAVAAAAKRWLVAARAVATAAGAGLRAAGRAVVAFVRRLGVGLRAIVHVVAAPVRSVARAVVAAARRIGVVVRRAGDMIGAAVRAVVQAAAELVRPVLRVCECLGRRLVGVVAAMRRTAWGAICSVVAIVAAGVGRAVRLVKAAGDFVGRPLAHVGRRAVEWSRTVVGVVARAGRTLVTRSRVVRAKVVSRVAEPLRSAGQTARRMRSAARQGLVQARGGVRRRAKAAGRDAEPGLDANRPPRR